MTQESTSHVRRWLPSLVLLAVGLLVPLFATSGFQLRIAMLIWIYAILGMGFNLLFGIAGQLSLGQQSFFAVSGYALALLQTQLGWPLEIALIASVLVSALLGLVIGIPILRLRSHYLAMATLMLGLIIEGVALRWFEVTGGTAGIRIPQPHLLGFPLSRTDIYYVVFALAVLTFGVHSLIISSHLGRALQSLRDDESTAEAMGINVAAYKIKIFAISATLSGLAGAAYALVGRLVEPSYSGMSININLLTIAVVGGLATYYGPLFGAVVVVLAPQFLVQFHEYELLLYGLGLLGFLIFLPRGLAGLIEDGKAFSFFLRRKARDESARAPAVSPAKPAESSPGAGA
jgi:branched-chain amino acid transport system permease protein